MDKVYVVVLNWNGWGDTIECLESLFRSAYGHFTVIVCDNGSADQSLDRIRAWAQGNLDVGAPARGKLRSLSIPPIPKPVTLVEYSRKQAEQGGVIGAIEPRLILIQTGGNLGFAGGNNVGLRYALARDAFSYVWLLNNDTVVAQDSLTELVQRANQLNSAGIVGSTLIYYHLPDRIQAYCGGAYNKLSGSTRYLGNGLSATGLNPDPASVERKIDYVSGASMLVSAEFLRVIGLMEEDYFLYFEELDWAVRSRGRFLMGYAPKSIVYHKEGAAIGSNTTDPAQKSALADYFGIRNRLLFTKRHVPWALPFVYCGLLPTLVNRVRRGQWDRALMVIRLALGMGTRQGSPGGGGG